MSEMSEGVATAIIVVAIILWIGAATMCAVVARVKGESEGTWFVVGLIFSWMALIAIAGMPDNKTDRRLQSIESLLQRLVRQETTPTSTKGVPQPSARPSARLQRLRSKTGSVMSPLPDPE